MVRLNVVFVTARRVLIVAVLVGLLAAAVAPWLSTQAASPMRKPGGTGIFATVKVAHLNVRRAPRITASILGVLNLNDVVPVLGRNSRFTWLQVSTPFGTGWIAALLISTNEDITGLPVTESSISPFVTIEAIEGANIRLGPFRSYPVLDVAPFGAELDIIGLHSKGTWLQVVTGDGTIGWVDVSQVLVTGNLRGLPVTDLSVRPLAIVVPYRLRIHSLPDTDSPEVGVARQGELYTIIGMDIKELFWKVVGPRGTGWVVAGFTTPIGYLSEVPVLDS